MRAPLLLALCSVAACSKATPEKPIAEPTAAVAAPSGVAGPTVTAADATATVGALRTLSVGSLPKGVHPAGILDKALAWTDKNGENVALFSRISKKDVKGKPFVTENGPYESGYLYVQHYLATDPPKLLREVRDKVEGCDADLTVDFRDGANAVTDLDGDGIGELTFAYAMSCASDMSPATLKLVMLENGDKYILRGTTRIAAQGLDPATGGAYAIDPSFKNGPPAFLKHAKQAWLKVRAHDAPAAASDASMPACSALAWSKGDDPTAKVGGLTGKLHRAEGSTWNGSMEKYLFVDLDKPVCSPDGTSQPTIQVNPASLEAAAKLDGKRVSVTGDAEEAQTSHDHFPIVVRGTVSAL